MGPKEALRRVKGFFEGKPRPTYEEPIGPEPAPDVSVGEPAASAPPEPASREGVTVQEKPNKWVRRAGVVGLIALGGFVAAQALESCSNENDARPSATATTSPGAGATSTQMPTLTETATATSTVSVTATETQTRTVTITPPPTSSPTSTKSSPTPQPPKEASTSQGGAEDSKTKNEGTKNPDTKNPATFSGKLAHYFTDGVKLPTSDENMSLTSWGNGDAGAQRHSSIFAVGQDDLAARTGLTFDLKNVDDTQFLKDYAQFLMRHNDKTETAAKTMSGTEKVTLASQAEMQHFLQKHVQYLAAKQKIKSTPRAVNDVHIEKLTGPTKKLSQTDAGEKSQTIYNAVSDLQSDAANGVAKLFSALPTAPAVPFEVSVAPLLNKQFTEDVTTEVARLNSVQVAATEGRVPTKGRKVDVALPVGYAVRLPSLSELNTMYHQWSQKHLGEAAFRAAQQKQLQELLDTLAKDSTKEKAVAR
ncbi:MAG: hypothetical protein WBP03_02315 [Candidatus Saccharimonadales bacterium]|jgi:hypothetical protein